jgi:uncharacterized protein (DUF1697 family)
MTKEGSSMPRYIAFLRAINVGGHIVPMVQLRQRFEALGFSNVETFIASGNVIFDAPARNTKKLEGTIEAALRKELGYEVTTFVRTPPEVARIAAYKPFSDAELEAKGHELYLGFLTATPTAEAEAKLMSLASDEHAFHLAGREVYWLFRVRFSESRVTGATLEKTLKLPTTLRNVRTVRRIAAKVMIGDR